MLQRILVTHIPAFGSLRDTVTWHVEHEYSNEMKRKSFVIPLGVQLQNENVTSEMITIMDKLHRYIPKKSSTETFLNSSTGESDEYTREQFHEILIGGDQLMRRKGW